MENRVSSETSRIETLSRMLCTADGRQELASELEAMLFRDALDAHWPATHDRACGGFLTDFDRRWRASGEQTKSLEFQARQTWAYARAARLYPGRGYDEAARHGYEFLTEKMWDGADGGFSTLVDRQGKPLEQGRKHPHGHTYALESFIELAPLIGEPAARQWARRTFDWLETVAWDSEHGGYYGYYHRDNRPILRHELSHDAPLDWLGTPIGLKDLNVLGDALGALTALAASGWDKRAQTRLDWHVGHYLDRLIGLFELIPHFYTANWSAAPDLPRSGQSLQLIAAFLAATSGTRRAMEGLVACKTIADSCARFFGHRDGGYSFARSICIWPLLGVELMVPERSWWIQTEASRGCLQLALLSLAEDARRIAFARQWAFVEKRLIDPNYHGFYASAEDGDRARRQTAKLQKTHIWKDVSHEAHLLMDAVGWLRDGPDFDLSRSQAVQSSTPSLTEAGRNL